MSAIDDLLATARSALDRVEPDELGREVDGGALVVDIRPAADRAHDGELPGALVIERIHLEWRLDPTSGHSVPGAAAERRIVVVCNEGYASSLAAATLRELGLHRATDLVGGYRGWRSWTESRATDRPAGPPSSAK